MTTNAVHTELISWYRGGTPVRSRLSYRTSEPFSVTAAFQTHRDRWVEWMFARDLLVEGLTGPSGVGDVRMRPGTANDLEVIFVEIESPKGFACLEMERAGIEAFLQATAQLVPIGSEADHFDVDGLIAELIKA